MVAAKQLARQLIYDLGRPFTAHDVRKLRQCAICGGIGYLPQMLTLQFDADAKPVHGACVATTMTEDQILSLPPDEATKLRLNEIGPELMRKLLDRSCPLSDVEMKPKFTAKQQVLLDYLKAGWRLGRDQCLSNYKSEERPPFVHRRTIAGLKKKGVLVYEIRNARYVLTALYK